ncbi:glycoside hydrolase family 24 protein [Azohydromonas lata]|uniref:glycoside hydrolase family 24 protein n=1 Tax=Azohydromonas lata TaxID=45677 RepID=UPI001EE4B96B|nr:glycoside hydrolase family 104 protein [Azohydromonas lata]
MLPTTEIKRLRAALVDTNVQAFLAVIRAGEGTAGEDGYRTRFGGGLFDSLIDHPGGTVSAKSGGRVLVSSAAGAYQFLLKTWRECQAALALPDFSSASQDLAAVFLIDRRRALVDVLAGRIEAAIAKCNREWASLPGSPYGQPVVSLARALETYRVAGGVSRPAGTPAPVEARDIPTEPVTRERAQALAPNPQEPAMAPFIAAALPAVINAVPELAKLFGSGSKVAERNAKAAEVVVGIAQDALGARNAQEVAEQLQSDPAAAPAVRAAVQERWFELQEAGGGGIEGARKADAAFVAGSGDIKRSPSFWIAVALVPLVYLIVGNVVGLFGSPLSDEVRSAISNGVVGLILGAVSGYYFGQTTTRNRTPAGKE